MGSIKTNFKVTDITNRTLIGFDLRKESSLNHVFMTSYDEDVRYEKINEEFIDYQTGMNLFYMCPDNIPLLVLPTDARIIAFDLPTEYVNYLSNGEVSSPQPLPVDKIGDQWEFMGFDIIDAIKQTSAFYGLYLKSSQLEQVLHENLFNLNSHGLLDSNEDALRGSLYFNERVFEHSPFLPCGI